MTPVPGATTAQPDDRITLTAGNVSVALVPISRARTYQAALAILDCETSCPDDGLHGFRVTLYSAEGEPEKDPRLIQPARITLTMDSETVSELGGMAVLLQTQALGGVALLSALHGELDGYGDNQFGLDIEPDGAAIVTAETRRISGDWALVLDADILAQARAQLSAALGTPTATPIPTATPSPAPTAIPDPTATPAPPVAPPSTGDNRMPPILALAFVLAAALVAMYGARATLRRVRGR